MKCAVEDENGSSNIHLQKRQRTENKIRSAMLDFDVLDCPICIEPLTNPIFQCENGNLACSSCCPKLGNKCPQCDLPIGHIRCRAVESVLESIFVNCRNTEFGCNGNVAYGKKSTHEDKCIFSQCSCPVLDCNFTCSYKDLHSHYYSIHKKRKMFTCGDSRTVYMNSGENIAIIIENWNHRMFAVQRYRESYGVYVTVSCIAPNAPEIEDFSCLLSYTTLDGHALTYQIPKVKKVLKVSFAVPQENVMLISLTIYFLVKR